MTATDSDVRHLLLAVAGHAAFVSHARLPCWFLPPLVTDVSGRPRSSFFPRVLAFLAPSASVYGCYSLFRWQLPLSLSAVELAAATLGRIYSGSVPLWLRKAEVFLLSAWVSFFSGACSLLATDS